MPFYEYQCRHCGHHLEALQKLSDAPLKKCPSCGRAQLARIVSRVAFRLKGGGWYETDFKSDGENKRNLVGDESASEPAAPAEAAKAEAAKPAGPEQAKGDQAKAKTPAKAAPAKARGTARKAAPAKTRAKPASRARKPATRAKRR
jgi:putative FmdB family regulatory protein